MYLLTAHTIPSLDVPRRGLHRRQQVLLLRHRYFDRLSWFVRRG
jgi:hypothetical protein